MSQLEQQMKPFYYDRKSNAIKVRAPHAFYRFCVRADNKTLIDLCIQHAKLCVRHANPQLDDGAEDTCALCQVYRYDNDVACQGCPISGITGRQYCEGTPYVRRARSAKHKWQTMVQFLNALRKVYRYIR